jgi:shikimate kinase
MGRIGREPEGVKRHLVIVGLPGAGKTTVGRIVARDLGTQLHDIDATIERRFGIPISEIFAKRGEAEFREHERAETLRALAGDPAVIVPGGGWAAQPGNMDEVGVGAVTVYLKTSPATARQRLAGERVRPLLSGPRSTARTLEELYVERRAYYERCKVTVSTEGKKPSEVANEVLEVASSRGGL